MLSLHLDVRLIFLSDVPFNGKLSRTLQRYPMEQSDPTQSYHFLDSQDLPDMERRIFPAHDLQDDRCIPSSKWQSMVFPTCNNVHALDLQASVTHHQQAFVLSNRGFWRTAWEYVEDTTLQNDDHQSSLVLKTFKLDHSMEDAFFEHTRVDALAMERLTHSKHIVNIYSHCGMTILTEFAGQEVPLVADKLLPLERLKLAKQVAQGIAHIHAIGVVHNDLNFANVVFSKSKKVAMINDFNLSTLRLKDKDTGKPCAFTSLFPNPVWRAPQEQRDEDGSFHPVLDEKIDIYGLGNILFRFAVGMGPWKQMGNPSLSASEVRNVESWKRQGQLPPIPQEIRDQDDPSIDALLRIMKECYSFDPNARPTATQVVFMLQSAIGNITASQIL